MTYISSSAIKNNNSFLRLVKASRFVLTLHSDKTSTMALDCVVLVRFLLTEVIWV